MGLQKFKHRDFDKISVRNKLNQDLEIWTATVYIDEEYLFQLIKDAREDLK